MNEYTWFRLFMWTFAALSLAGVILVWMRAARLRRLLRELTLRPPIQLDLELVTGQQLIDELRKRNEPAHVVATFDERGPLQGELRVHVNGMPACLAGTIMIEAGKRIRSEAHGVEEAKD